MTERIKQLPLTITTDRECGSCTACCIWLGVEELQKYTGQKCKHLKGPAAIHKRCGIYHRRPMACVDYSCMWREGWGQEEWQPHKSGILITPYPDPNDPEKATITMNIFDLVKAKDLIKTISLQLIMVPFITEVRVINIQTKRALMYKNGNIYRCQLLPAEGFESLMFAAEDDPIGRYRIE
jgi:Fe-S-cluster containining protein